MTQRHRGERRRRHAADHHRVHDSHRHHPDLDDDDGNGEHRKRARLASQGPRVRGDDRGVLGSAVHVELQSEPAATWPGQRR
jgi:hypothetical protein